MRSKTLLLLTAALALNACAQKELPKPCYEKPASGQCKAAHKRFYYDPGARVCKPFIWGGCNGRVPFETLEACKDTCNAPGPEEAATFKKPAPSTPTEK
jgi:hypothetical protein